jgi:hypothetical protein
MVVDKGRGVATWDVLVRFSDKDTIISKCNTDIARSVNGVGTIASLQVWCCYQRTTSSTHLTQAC